VLRAAVTATTRSTLACGRRAGRGRTRGPRWPRTSRTGIGPPSWRGCRCWTGSCRC